MKRSCGGKEVVAHPCRSPAHTVNGCDLTPSTRTQTSKKEYELTASDRLQSTPYSRNTAQSFSRVHVLKANLIEFEKAVRCTNFLTGLCSLCFFVRQKKNDALTFKPTYLMLR